MSNVCAHVMTVLHCTCTCIRIYMYMYVHGCACTVRIYIHVHCICVPVPIHVHAHCIYTCKSSDVLNFRHRQESIWEFTRQEVLGTYDIHVCTCIIHVHVQELACHKRSSTHCPSYM